MEKSRVRALVEGEVQGVGYRYLVASLARRFSLRGSVKNLDDVRVEVVAEGEEENIKKFLSSINIQEPPIAVEKVETEYGEATGEFKTFRIAAGKLEEEMVEGFDTWASYLRMVLGLQRETLGEVKASRQLQEETLSEVRAVRKVQEERLSDLRGSREARATGAGRSEY